MNILRRLNLFLIVVTILLSACSRSLKTNDKDKEVIKFDLGSSNDNIPQIKILNIIKLEMSNASVIGNISKIDYYKNFYVLDKYISKSFFVFDSTGKFINKTKNGRGPDEILEPFSFSIDTKDNKVYLHDQASGSILKYDSALNLIEKRKYPEVLIHNFQMIGRDTFLVNHRIIKNKEIDNAEYYAYTLYMHDFTKECHFNILLYNNTDPQEMAHPINKRNQEILFMAPWNYNVFQLSGDKVKIRYILDFGNYNFSEKELRTLPGRKMWEEVHLGQKIGPIPFFFKTKDFIIISTAFKRNILTIFYSLNSKKDYLLSNCIKLNLLPNCIVWGEVNNDTFWGTVEPADLIKFKDQNKSIPSMEVQEKDNPYIIFFKINDIILK